MSIFNNITMKTIANICWIVSLPVGHEALFLEHIPHLQRYFVNRVQIDGGVYRRRRSRVVAAILNSNLPGNDKDTRYCYKCSVYPRYCHRGLVGGPQRTPAAAWPKANH